MIVSTWSLVDTSIVSTPNRTPSRDHTNPGRRPRPEAYCAYDADSPDDAAAERLAANDPRTIRTRPQGAKNWNEILMRSR